MQDDNLNHAKLLTVFWAFLLLHTLLWTIGPALTRDSLPHDTLEAITWGLQWQFGYHKHPFLTAWLCALAAQLSRFGDWPIYLLAQIAVATTFIAVFQLARKIFNTNAQVLVATLSIEGVLFYNINSFNFTPDTLQSPLWALVCLFYYQAMTLQKIRYWLLLGATAGLSVLTKYQAVVLLIPLLLFALINPIARQNFKKPGIYLTLFVFTLTLAPHINWLFEHDFITLRHASQVGAEYTKESNAINHVLFPLKLLTNALIAIGCVFLLIWPFHTLKRSNFFKKQPFQSQFLITTTFGPLALTLFLCALSGDYFPPRWLTPYFFSLGLWIVADYQLNLSSKNIQRYLVTVLLSTVLLFSGRMLSLSVFARTQSDAGLPNKAIAAYVIKQWQVHFKGQPPYLAGSNYLVSSVIPYMSQKPTPYFNWSHQQSPWIEPKKLYSKGGVFIWDEQGNYTWDKDSLNHMNITDKIRHRFPMLLPTQTAVFYHKHDKIPIQIKIAVLPPNSSME